MENGRPQPSESDGDNTQESVGSKRRSREFLTYYQRLLGRRPSLEEALNPTETEDDEEDEEQPKKWRGFFKRLFGNVVTPPDTEEKSENKHGFNADAWYAWQMTPVAETVVTPAEVEEQQAAEPNTHESPEDILDVDRANEAAPEPEMASELSEAPESPIVVPTELSKDTIQAVPSPEMPDLPVVEVEAAISHSQPNQEATQPLIERETVIERNAGGGLPLLLVGAEYLGRKHADKKIRKEFNQKINSVEQKNVQQEANQSQLEDLIKQNKEQLETLKRERGMAAELKEQPRPAMREVKPNLPPPEERVPTERILESVADAAEHNVPVERVFERSHEVKDEPSVAGGNSSAQSVGAVIAAQMAQHQATSAPQLQVIPSQGLPIVVDQQAAQDLYAQAIKSGFIGAIMLIILGLLAYLVIQ